MEQKIVVRYSISFKMQVIEDIESGRFSIHSAQVHYGIGGKSTISKWLKKYGKNHLCAKVVRVEKPNEKDRIKELKSRIKELEIALGKTQAKSVLGDSFLEIACKELGTDVESFKKKRNFTAVHSAYERTEQTVTSLCAAAGMTRQNYYKSRSLRQSQEVASDIILAHVHRERKIQPKLGARKLLVRISQSLMEQGVSIGRDRLFNLLRHNDLLIKRKSKYCVTTDSRHRFRVYCNLLYDADVTGPNQVVVSDITYLRVGEKFVYLALVTDYFSRSIVGWYCNDSLESLGAQKALGKALKQLPEGCKIIHHSDRGSQYCCHAYIKMLDGHQISMTEKNHCYENSKAERVNGILKQEYGLDGVFKSKADVLKAVREAVYLYNNLRPHQALGYRYPAQVHAAA